MSAPPIPVPVPDPVALSPQPTPPLLEVRDLSIGFAAPNRPDHQVPATIEGLSLSVPAGQTLGLVGESGSGKSLLALAVMGLLPSSARILGGSLRVDGQDLLSATPAQWQHLRRHTLAMVFQNPRQALNPVRPIWLQLQDALRSRAPLSPPEARAQALALLEQVEIDQAPARLQAYPHELSGGMCQRVLLALALSREPRLLLADEPTTGLDISTQAAILKLLGRLARERRMATLLITHNLAMARQHCSHLAVMHAGQLVETGPADQVLEHPLHPYTRGLRAATPRRGLALADLQAMPGSLPDLSRLDLPACRFAGRCLQVQTRCDTQAPEWRGTAPGASTSGHRAACWSLN